MKRLFIPLLMLVIIVGLSHAAERDSKSITLPEIKVQLEPGEGMDKTAVFCNICHSLDYITTQPKGSKAQWTATVNKMRKVMGAPIPDADAAAIVNYLSAHYGSGK